MGPASARAGGDSAARGSRPWPGLAARARHLLLEAEQRGGSSAWSCAWAGPGENETAILGLLAGPGPMNSTLQIWLELIQSKDGPPVPQKF
jgi:hypothetical protein